MNILELAQAAVDSVNNTPTEITPTLAIKLPGKWSQSQRKYLAGPKSPQGSIVQESFDGVIVIFDALEVLIWCAANGANIVMVPQPNNGINPTAESASLREVEL